jgi:hypothetical protein
VVWSGLVWSESECWFAVITVFFISLTTNKVHASLSALHSSTLHSPLFTPLGSPAPAPSGFCLSSPIRSQPRAIEPYSRYPCLPCGETPNSLARALAAGSAGETPLEPTIRPARLRRGSYLNIHIHQHTYICPYMQNCAPQVPSMMVTTVLITSPVAPSHFTPQQCSLRTASKLHNPPTHRQKLRSYPGTRRLCAVIPFAFCAMEWAPELTTNSIYPT